MTDVALLNVRAVPPPPVQKDRTIIAEFAAEIAGVTLRRCLLFQAGDRHWVIGPRCHHEDAEVRFAPALNRALTRMALQELSAPVAATGRG